MTDTAIKTLEDNIDYNTAVDEGLYATTTSFGLYGIRSQTGPATKPIVDFDAVARVWLSDINDFWYDGALGILPKKYAVRLNIEISWPKGIPYSKREKRYYMLEVFRQQ